MALRYGSRGTFGSSSDNRENDGCRRPCVTSSELQAEARSPLMPLAGSLGPRPYSSTESDQAKTTQHMHEASFHYKTIFKRTRNASRLRAQKQASENIQRDTVRVPCANFGSRALLRRGSSPSMHANRLTWRHATPVRRDDSFGAQSRLSEAQIILTPFTTWAGCAT